MSQVVDKKSVERICVDDFAFKKRYTYGTIMIDIDSHRIIDILDSRDKDKVVEWLKTYPNIKVVSRDGSVSFVKESFGNSRKIYVQVISFKIRNTCYIKYHIVRDGSAFKYP